MSDQPLTYLDAGVDLDTARKAIRAVSPAIQATFGESVVGGIGSFGGMFLPDFASLERPLLVSSIDGVGTKTRVAAMTGHYENLGRDIVHHCVNDILCQGARPLFFLDYFGCASLDRLEFEAVVRGAAEACLEVGCALVGGETAEMPGVYGDGEVDVVGAIVGVVDYGRRLPRPGIRDGDAVIGLASDGLHTNGYTLARKALFERGGLSVRDEIPGLGATLGEELLRPHRCYFHALYPLIQEFEGIRALAHITGGGLYDNIPRVVPPEFQVVIDRRSWTTPPIFTLIQSTGNVPDVEMYRTFNMGIGMALIADREIAPALVQRLIAAGESATVIGSVQRGPHDVLIA